MTFSTHILSDKCQPGHETLYDICVAELRSHGCEVRERSGASRTSSVVLPDGQEVTLPHHEFTLLCVNTFLKANGE